MEPATARAIAPAADRFEDGLGERHHLLDTGTNQTLEVLCLRSELTAIPSFEFALRERVGRLASFRHASYRRVRSVERLDGASSTLAVVSDHTPGARLSDVLDLVQQRRVVLDIDAALCLIRQLVPAVAALHETARDVAHGAISPARIIVTPNARLVVTEYVLGAALEQLRYSNERYWKELGLALPRSPGLARFDHRADVTQVGVVALSLILGRPLADDEYPEKIGEVLASAWATSSRGDLEPLRASLRSWLSRALQIDVRHSFASTIEAAAELEKVLSDSNSMAEPAVLEGFLSRYHACVEPASPPATSPHAAALPPVPKIDAPASTLVAAAAPKVETPPAPKVEVSPAATVQTLPPPNVEMPAAARPKTLPPVPKIDMPVPAARPKTPPPGPKLEIPAPVTLGVNAPAKHEPKPGIEPTIEPKSGSKYQPPHDVAEEAVADLLDTSESPRRTGRLIAAAVVLIALASGGAFTARRYFQPAPMRTTTGTLVVNTDVPGAQVLIDGQSRGATPLTLTLNPGPHTLELRGGGAPRTIPVTIVAGAEVSQYIELPKTRSEGGQLQVRTTPAGARVTIDGVPRGTSPLAVDDLRPGPHTVVLENDLESVTEEVTIAAGATASLVVPLTAPAGASVSGWLSLAAPIEVQVYEDGRLLGSSRSDRIMVSAGKHDIEIMNERLGYREARSVQVAAGKVVTIRLELPHGTIAVNALPWADVWIDGEKKGETPIGNLSLPIGSHEIVFRHPELGEQRHVATVTLTAPTRVSVDMRKQ